MKRCVNVYNKEILDDSEYEQLKEDEDVLRALEAAGVDGWEGFEYAQEFMSDKE